MPQHLEDTPALRRLWSDGYSLGQIAMIYGRQSGAMAYQLKVLGYPPRDPVTLKPTGSWPAPTQYASVPRVGQRSVENRNVAPGRWTDAQVAAVLQTGGAYSGLAVLASRWNVSHSRVLQLWHSLRAAA